MPRACCMVCRKTITINAHSGREYGHAKDKADGTQKGVTPCPHRPSYVEPHRCSNSGGGHHAD